MPESESRVWDLVLTELKRISDVQVRQERRYMTREQIEAEIRPIRAIAYSSVGVICIAFLSGLAAVVWRFKY